MQSDKQRGMSLVELVIAMAVMAILAVIAVPSYASFIANARQADAQEFMTQVSTAAARYKLQARAYPTALGEKAGQLDLDIPEEIANRYTITLAGNNAATPPTFLVTATPKAEQMPANSPVMTLNSSGVKTPAKEW